MNYGDLKELIRFYSHRKDLDDVFDRIADIVSKRIGKYGRLTEQAMVLTPVTVSSNPHTLPTDFGSIISLSMNGHPMSQTPEASYDSLETAGTNDQYVFKLIGRNAYFSPLGALTGSYYASPPPLLADDNENDVLTNHPELYRAGFLLEVAIIERDVAYARDMEALFTSEINQANARADDSRTALLGPVIR